MSKKLRQLQKLCVKVNFFLGVKDTVLKEILVYEKKVNLWEHEKEKLLKFLEIK